MPRHIVHLARLYLPHKGGVETHVASIAQLELKQGGQVTIITTQDNPNSSLTEEIEGVNVIRIPYELLGRKRQVWQWISSQPSLQQADIIQAHDVFWWIWPVYFSVRQKLFMTFHGWEGKYPVRWQAKLQRYIANKLCQGSMHVGAWIQEFYWDKPNFITYGAIDEPAVRLAKHGLATIETKIIFVGRLEAENEIALHIQLFSQLKSRFPDLKIEWIGDGVFRNECEKIGPVLGMIEDPWLHAKHATLIAANSYLSILNAQALGKVVIGLYSNKLKQRYLETYPGASAMLIGGSVADMINSVSLFLQDPTPLKLLSSQAESFAATQTWDKVALLYEQLWQRKKLA